jgi:hypothetical protein
MTKHASTSNCISNNGGGSCGGVPSPSPQLPCLLPLLCTPSLPSLLPLTSLSPWRCPRSAAAANDNSSKHGAPPKPSPLSYLLSTWGGGKCACCSPPCRPLWPIAAASPRRIGIIAVLVAVAILPPHPCLLLPPATKGSVAIDIYWHDQLKRAHGLADGAPAPMFLPGMGQAEGG